MLGPQARAAELRAAKSAAMRQKVQRDSEEQSTPPKSASVSLTDFARSSLLSKNKGIKAFRPLNDSDFVEAARADRSPPVAAETVSITPLRENIRVNLPETVPTAPRAMLVSASRTPSRLNLSSRDNIMRPQLDHEASPETKGGWRNNERSVLASAHLERTVTDTSHVFGPYDLSPMKQEDKFADIRRRLSLLQLGRAQSQQHATMLHAEARVFTPHPQYHSGTSFDHQDMHTQLPFDPYMLDRPQMPHYHSEAGASDPIHLQNRTRLDRTYSFANDVLNHQNRLQQARAISPPKLHRGKVESEQSYDRNSKMQSFVAAQQAMAKKGKTVLHNPALYKSPSPSSTPPPEDACIMRYPKAAVIASLPFRHLVNIPASDSTLSSLSKLGIEGDEARFANSESHKGEDQSCSNSPGLKRFEKQSTRLVNESKKFEITLASGRVVGEEWFGFRSITQNEKNDLRMLIKQSLYDSTSSSDFDHVDTLTVAGDSCATQECSIAKSSQRSERWVRAQSIIENHRERAEVSSAFGVIGIRQLNGKLTESKYRQLEAVAQIMTALHDSFEERRLDPDIDEFTTVPEPYIDAKAALDPFRGSIFEDPASFSERR